MNELPQHGCVSTCTESRKATWKKARKTRDTPHVWLKRLTCPFDFGLKVTTTDPETGKASAHPIHYNKNRDVLAAFRMTLSLRQPNGDEAWSNPVVLGVSRLGRFFGNSMCRVLGRASRNFRTQRHKKCNGIRPEAGVGSPRFPDRPRNLPISENEIRPAVHSGVTCLVERRTGDLREPPLARASPSPALLPRWCQRGRQFIAAPAAPFRRPSPRWSSRPLPGPPPSRRGLPPRHPPPSRANR